MAKPDDIHSTEKLLNVIRDTQPVNEGPVFPIPEPGGPKLFHLIRKLTTKSAHSVGVDLSDNCLRLVKMGCRYDRKPVILDYRSKQITAAIADDRSQLIDLLRLELSQFCPPSSQAAVWAALALEETDIRRLQLPKVAKSKLENAIAWTYQKEATADMDKLLLDYRILGEVVDNGVAKIEVIVCTAPKASVEEKKAIFKAAGTDLTGVLAPAFAFQNFFKAGWVDIGEGPACSLHIDLNWSRIDVFLSNGDLVVSRGIKAGISSMVESIKSETIHPPDNQAVTGTANESEPVLELPAFNAVDADRILQVLCTDTPTPPSSMAGLIQDSDVFDMVLPALERLVRQVERTLEHVVLRFSGSPVEKMFISGPITAYPRLVEYIGDQLGLSVESMDPFATVSPGVTSPGTVSDRSAYISAASLALSSSGRPPNFLLTRKETVIKNRSRRLRGGILVLFLAGVVAIWSSHLLQQRQIQDLEMALYKFNIAATPEEMPKSREALLALADRVKQKRQTWKNYSRNYLPVAVIGEITALAPDHVRFIRIEGNNAEPSEGNRDEDRSETAATTRITVTVDAVVYGSLSDVEARFANYLMALKRSPLFARVTLKKKSFEQLESKDVLRFALDLEGA